MANSNKLFLIIFSFFFLHQLIIFSNGQINVVKGGYWFRDSGLALNDIDSTLFTHLFCAFADLNPQTNQLIVSPENQDSFRRFTSTVQRKNPSVKTLLSIGGGRADRAAYGVMARAPNSRRSFIDSSIRLARELGFHGLDLDWEYPESATDMTNLGTVIVFELCDHHFSISVMPYDSLVKYGTVECTQILPRDREIVSDGSSTQDLLVHMNYFDLMHLSFEGLSENISLPLRGRGILLDEFRAAVNTEARNSGRAALLLTAAVSNSPRVNGLNYPVQSVARNLDWLNLMAYDFYGPNWSPSQTNSHAQLFDPVSHVSGSDGINSWIQAGVPTRKLVLGIPFYGYAWRLVDANIHGLRAPASGKSNVGSSDDGSMTYSQIRNFIVQNRATTVYNATIVGDYCYSGNAWISYDDNQSVRNKVTYVKGRGLLGYFAWHVAADQNSGLARAASQTWGASSQVM